MKRTSSPIRLSPQQRHDFTRLHELDDVFFPSNQAHGTQRKQNKEAERTSFPPLPFRLPASAGYDASSPLSARGLSPNCPITFAGQPTGFGSNSVFKDYSSIQLILPSALEMSSDLHSLERVKLSLDTFISENLNGKGGPRVDTTTHGPNARAASPSRPSRVKLLRAEDLNSSQVNVLVGSPGLPPINITQFMGEKPSDRRRVQVMSEWLDTRIKGAWMDFQLAPASLDKSIRDELKIEQLQGIYGSHVGREQGSRISSPPFPPANLSEAASAFTSFPNLGSNPDDEAPPSPTLVPAYPFAPETGSRPYAEIPIRPMFGTESRLQSPSATRHINECYQADFEQVNRTLLASTLTSVSACATSLIHHSGSVCYEEGALLARLWNLQTSVMDSVLLSSQREAAKWSSEAKKLKDKVKVLDPLIGWEREAKGQIDSLSSELESTRNLLSLACSERDAALHENNKIIVHYRKELKEFKKKQRRDAFQLACKVKNQLKQLELMQKDRDQLIAAVNSTKAQVTLLQGLAVNLRVQVSKDLQGEESIDMEMDIKAMQQALAKLNDMVKETEDSYFASEEQLTLVSAKDEVDEELVDMVLSEGDPDGRPLVDFEADLIRPMNMTDDDKMDEEDEDEDSPRSPRSAKNGRKALALTLEERAAAALLLVPEEPVATEALEPATEVIEAEASASSPVKEFVDASIQTDILPDQFPPDQSPSSRSSSPPPVPAINLHDASVSAAASMADASTSAHATPRPPPPPPPCLHDSTCQTDIALLAPLIEPKVLEAVKAAKVEAAQLVASRVLHLTGIDLQDNSHASRSESPVSKEAEPSGVDPLEVLAFHISDSVVALKRESEALKSESEAQKVKASKELASIQDSIKAAKADADISLGKYAALKVSLRAMGVDPEDPRLPTMTPLPPDPHDHPSLSAAADVVSPKKGGGKMRASRASSRSPSPTLSHAPPPKRESTAPVTRSSTKVAKVSRLVIKKQVDAPPPSTPGAGESSFKALKTKAVDKMLTGAQKLQEAVAKFEGVKPRTLEWLIKIIDSVYKGKASNDEQRAKAGQGRINLVDYIFQHLSGMFGTAQLVQQYAAQLVSTIDVYRKKDVRVSVFHRFMTETWTSGALDTFLHGLQKLSEPARVSCCDFPPDYVPPGASRMSQSVADVRKCLWVADKVLMKRHAKTAYAFAASLALKGEAVPEEEVVRWFAAPGHYGPDVANARAQEQGRVEFRSIPTFVFLEALVDEYLRCEAVYSDMLPAIFKRWDHDRDGLMYRSDLDPMLEHIAPKGTPLSDLISAAETLWSDMVQAEVKGMQLGVTEPGTSLPAPSTSVSISLPSSPYMKKRGEVAVPSPSTVAKDSATSIATELQRFGALGFRAFLEGALKCDLIRSYVRLYKTPPAKVKIDNSAQEQAKLLLFVLIQRHWAIHGPSLSLLFKSMPGALPSQMTQQVALMEAERDGMRKAILLHSILKSLIGHKVDRIITHLSISASGSSARPGNGSLVQEDFELSIHQLTSAAKILFGGQFILVDDIVARYSKTPDVEESQSQAKSVEVNAPSLDRAGLTPRLTPRPSPRPQGPSSLSIREAQRQQDLQTIKLFNLLKARMPELSRSYLASHPSVTGRTFKSRLASIEATQEVEAAFISPDPLMLPTAGAVANHEEPPAPTSLGRSVSFAALSPEMLQGFHVRVSREEDLDELIDLVNKS